MMNAQRAYLEARLERLRELFADALYASTVAGLSATEMRGDPARAVEAEALARQVDEAAARCRRYTRAINAVDGEFYGDEAW